MARVHSLYGHIQRNDRKSAILIATFESLFLITQFSFRLVYFWPMAQLEASGTLQPMSDDAPLIERLLGLDGILSTNGRFEGRSSHLVC